MHKLAHWTVAALASGLMLSSLAQANVTISQGEPVIPDGTATHRNDITVQNEHLAFALAVESSAPWGVPRGTLVDLAAVQHGTIDPSRVAFADFIPNNWSAWPNDRRDIEIVEDSTERAVIEVSRNFGEVDITTSYTLASGSDTIELKTVMTNEGEDTLELQSGFTIWPDTGHLFPVPGLDEGGLKGTQTLSDRTIGYNRDWAFALHAPYFDRNTYGGRDMYQVHSLAPGESRTFAAYLQVVGSGDLAPIVAAEAERRGEPTGTLTGEVLADDQSVPENGMVLIEKNAELFAWTLAQGGEYSISLPAGEYQVYGTASGHANSARESVVVKAGSEQALNFTDLAGPGTLALSVTGSDSAQPEDARVRIIAGQEPPVEFLGKRTFFTQIEPVGQADIELPPGDYQLSVESGAGFTSTAEPLSVSLASGDTKAQQVTVEQLTDPNDYNWFAADLHHHGDVLEAVTPAETVVRAQLAAGLDLTFLSEHDSTRNYDIFAELSAQRDVPFIPSIEISPSWAHMNPFPIDLDAELTVDPGTDDIHSLMEAMRDMGATVISMNHPFNAYGYYTNLAQGDIPGGATDSFDLMELNSSNDDWLVRQQAHELWDQGETMYFSAGTDTHDAWNQESGAIRMFGYVPAELTPQTYADALLAGRGYATQGPILYPQNIMFGEQASPGDQWELDLVAVHGLRTVRLVGQGGEVLRTINTSAEQSPRKLSLTLPIPADAEGWVSLEVVDQKDNRAWSNPVWLQL